MAQAHLLTLGVYTGEEKYLDSGAVYTVWLRVQRMRTSYSECGPWTAAPASSGSSTKQNLIFNKPPDDSQVLASLGGPGTEHKS